MTLRNQIMPYVAAGISSTIVKKTKRQFFEFKRRLKKSPHRLDIFLKIDDPYSFLLVQVLEEFKQRFQVDINCYTVNALPEEMFPEHQMWRENAMHDAEWLATLYGLDYPTEIQRKDNKDKKTDPYTHALLNAETDENSLAKLNAIFRDYWLDEDSITSSEPLDTNLSAQLKSNEMYLQELGHYFSAMIHYAGEWYWGLDRLDHLEQRLNGLSLSVPPSTQVLFDKTWNSPNAGSQSTKLTEPLEIFFSARSPYSYLGLERAAELSQRLNIELLIKPVLPMVMRGMKVPNAKKMYIFLDTKREAEKLGIPYGKVADPLGPGVERCYALFDFAKSEGKALAYLLSYARRVNAEGVRAETDSGLKEIVERSGLSWYQARRYLEDDSWRIWAQENLDDMLSSGQWGVPAFRYGSLMVWGQDRLFQIEQEIIKTSDITQ